ncbi:MAG: hypothetical protein ACRD5L_08525 [Bryobacteraceae bacterium]
MKRHDVFFFIIALAAAVLVYLLFKKPTPASAASTTPAPSGSQTPVYGPSISSVVSKFDPLSSDPTAIWGPADVSSSPGVPQCGLGQALGQSTQDGQYYCLDPANPNIDWQ